MKNFNVCAYCRVSTDDQARYGYSINGQQEAIRKFIDLYYPNSTIKYFIDEGYTGRTLNRPNYQNMIKQISNYDYLIIWKLDRLSRSISDIANIMSLLQKNKTDLLSIQERIDVSTASGRAFVHIMSTFAQLESENTSERTKLGFIAKARNGEYPFPNPPVGYLLTKDRKLIPDIKYFELINDIYHHYFEKQYNINQIANKLSKDYTFNEKRIENICHKVLKNPIYTTGVFEYQNQQFKNIVHEVIVKNISKTIQPHKFNHYDYLDLNVTCCTCGKPLTNMSTKKKNNIYLYKYCSNCNKRINEKKLIKKINQAKIKYIANEINLKKHFVYCYNFDKKEVSINLCK